MQQIIPLTGESYSIKTNEGHIPFRGNVSLSWHMNCASIIKNILWEEIIKANLQAQINKKGWALSRLCQQKTWNEMKR